MANSRYDDLADSLASSSWSQETNRERWGIGIGNYSDANLMNMQTACLIDIMRSLRVIRRKLECPTLQLAVHAIPEIKKAVTKKKRKTKPRNRLKPSRN